MTLPASGTNAWYHREAALPGGRWRVRCIFSDEHPDGTVVADPGDTSGSFQLWTADLDAHGRPRIAVHPDATPGAPSLWFVALPEPSAERPAMTLVGYANPVLPVGVVATDQEFFHLPVRNDEQVGAIRWWSGDGVVDQVYVGERWRRRHVATALIYAASAYHQFNGWPERLHADGRRTEMGEHLVAGIRHPSRIPVLDRLMAPMDPASGEGGRD